MGRLKIRQHPLAKFGVVDVVLEIEIEVKICSLYCASQIMERALFLDLICLSISDNGLLQRLDK